MCGKALDASPFMLQGIPYCSKTQEMYEKIYEDNILTQKFFEKQKLFELKYCLHKYKSQEICKEAVNAYLPLLKFAHDSFVAIKMLKDLGNALSFQ